MRWWSSDEPLKENFHINTAKFDSTTATLFEKQRLCVRSIDLTGNYLAEGENMSIGYRRQTSLLTRQQFLHGIVSSQQSIWHVHRDEMYRRRSRFWAGIASLWIA